MEPGIAELADIPFEHLVNSVRQGGDPTFLFTLIERRLRPFFRRHFESAAADAWQKTACRLLEKIRMGQLSRPENILFYATGIAGHLREEHLRQKIRGRRTRSIEDLIWSPRLAVPATQEADLIREERSRALNRAMRHLETSENEIIRAFYFHDKSLSEIARAMGLSPVCVRKRKFRAVRKLRRIIERQERLDRLKAKLKDCA